MLGCGDVRERCRGAGRVRDDDRSRTSNGGRNEHREGVVVLHGELHNRRAVHGDAGGAGELVAAEDDDLAHCRTGRWGH